MDLCTACRTLQIVMNVCGCTIVRSICFMCGIILWFYGYLDFKSNIEYSISSQAMVSEHIPCLRQYDRGYLYSIGRSTIAGPNHFTLTILKRLGILKYRGARGQHILTHTCRAEAMECTPCRNQRL